MKSFTEPQIRASLVNCSRGEAGRAPVPDLTQVRWDQLDYLGWPDPSGSPRAWLVAHGSAGPLGLALRRTRGIGATRSAMCDVCVTSHSGDAVALTVATKAGRAGRNHDSTGLNLCRDLACSLYVRGLRTPTAARMRETLPQEAMVDRLRGNLETFCRRVLGDSSWSLADHSLPATEYDAWPAQA